jgi:hypothetical protein
MRAEYERETHAIEAVCKMFSEIDAEERDALQVIDRSAVCDVVVDDCLGLGR